MSLSPGTRLGPYQVIAPLGAGGMGEVYRAKDTRLGRDVAIKALPEAFASDPERVARFEREARLLASLNHANVAVLYGIEREAGSIFLALELIEGESLAARLQRGALPLDEALDVAAQVAAALEAAHDAGVIHRDLKPGNVMVRPDGVAKVLDFGLARGPGPAGAPSDLSQSPTMTSPATVPGMILGTAAYMSPEQAKGRVVDRRADVWAWGCLLFECLTGQRAFPGEDVSETLASILKTEPDWSALPAATPPGVRTLLERCLRKDPRERLRDTGDLRLLLAEARAAREPAATTAAPKRRESALFTIAVTVFASLAGVMATRLVSSPKPAAPRTLSLVTPDGLHMGAAPSDVAISPDGHWLAFAGTDSVGGPRLWLRDLSHESCRSLEGTGNGEQPFWAPDSRHLGFFAKGKLQILNLASGAVRSIADAPLPRGGAWGKGVILFQPRSLGPLMSVPDGGGEPSLATVVDSAHGEAGHRFPQFLPDGRHFLVVSLGDKIENTIALGEIGQRDLRTLFRVNNASGVTFAGPDWLIGVRDKAVKAQRLDLRALRMRGPVLEIPGLRALAPASNGSPVVSASRTGMLVQRGASGLATHFVEVDRDGRLLRAIEGPQGASERFDLSSDGRRLVFEFATDPQSTDLWIGDLERGRMQPVTFEGLSGNPAFSPDGRTIAFTRVSDAGMMDLWLMRSDGSDPRRAAPLLAAFNTALGWSPDGQKVLLRSQGTDTQQDLILVTLGDSAHVRPLLHTRFNEPAGAISPDGRWLAYVSDESGQQECRVRPLAGGEGPGIIVSRGAWADPTASSRLGAPFWRRDGRELLYLAADGRTLMSVAVTPGDPPTFGEPQRIFKLGPGVIDIAPGADLDRFVLSIVEGEELRSTATVLTDWSRLLETAK